MNSRERILSALNFKEPDKIPVDFGGHRSSGISAVSYHKLKKALGINTGTIYVYDVIQQLAIIEQPVLDLFEVDTIEMGRAFLTEESDWKDWVLPDGTPCKIPVYVNLAKSGDDWYMLTKDGNHQVGVQKKGCPYFEQTIYPMEHRDFENDSFEDIEKQSEINMWSAAPSPGGHLGLEGEERELLIAGAKKLRESTDKAIIGLFGGNMFESPQGMFKNENYLLYTAMYPEATIRFSEKLFEIHSDNLIKWLTAVGSYIDIIMFGDDFGSNAGPLIDPVMYREYYKPFHKKMWSMVKELAPHLKIQLHSCGSIEAFLPDLIDAGLDSVNPVQISAKDMNIDSLKQKYKGQITFWGGGCETQSILSSATPTEVRKHVKEQLKIMKGDGGFVFQQVHNILDNVPTDNILAMFETVKNFR